jgi:very-short-patch-repair endonuclease
MTLPEVLLWRQLRRGVLEGLKFRRQHPLGPYVLDFYCDEAKLAVEVDGIAHRMGDQPTRDERRDAWLESQGVRVLRFNATDVLKEMDGVVRTILVASRP